MFEKVSEAPAIAEDVYREATRIGSKVSGAVKDGVRTAGKQIKRGRDAAEDIRDAAEDMLDDAKRTIKRNPFASAAVIFAVGFLAGSIFGGAAMRRR